jgi:hypothetical protein
VPFVEVEIQSSDRASDRLVLRAESWSGTSQEYFEGPDVHVRLTCGAMTAESVLPAYIADAERLGPLFQEIDRDWRGWAGEKTAGVAGRDWLSASASHDGLGHVSLAVSLAAGWPETVGWSVRGTLLIDVGSAASIAKALDEWLLLVWPPEHRWRTPA